MPDKEHKPASVSKKPAIAASDLIRGASPRDALGATPQQSKGPTGNAFVDKGPFCSGKLTDAECFLTPDQRERLVTTYQLRVQAAETNYKIALVELRVDKLLQKESDLPWVVSLAIELVGLHLVGKISSALFALRSGGLKRLDAVLTEASVSMSDAPLAEAAERALRSASTQRISRGVKAAVDSARDASKTKLKRRVVEAAKSQKRHAVAYIDRLKDEAGLAFQSIREDTPVLASDIELVAMMHGLDAELHTISEYKNGLAQKLSRLEGSGVNLIGKRGARRHKLLLGSVGVMRHTRVVWAVSQATGQKVLRFETWDGQPTMKKFDRRGDYVDDKFRPARPVTAEPELGDVVPDEFKDVAIERHEQLWGAAPETIVTSAWWDTIAPRIDPFARAAAQRRLADMQKQALRNRSVAIPDQLKIKNPDDDRKE